MTYLKPPALLPARPTAMPQRPESWPTAAPRVRSRHSRHRKAAVACDPELSPDMVDFALSPYLGAERAAELAAGSLIPAQPIRT